MISAPPDFNYSTACVPFTLDIDALPLLYPYFSPFSGLCAVVQMHLGPNIPEKQATFRLVFNFLESAGAVMTQRIATIYVTGDRTAWTPSFKVAWTTVKNPVLEPKTQTMYMPCSKVKYCHLPVKSNKKLCLHSHCLKMDIRKYNVWSGQWFSILVQFPSLWELQ